LSSSPTSTSKEFGSRSSRGAWARPSRRWGSSWIRSRRRGCWNASPIHRIVAPSSCASPSAERRRSSSASTSCERWRRSSPKSSVGCGWSVSAIRFAACSPFSKGRAGRPCLEGRAWLDSGRHVLRALALRAHPADRQWWPGCAESLLGLRSEGRGRTDGEHDSPPPSQTIEPGDPRPPSLLVSEVDMPSFRYPSAGELRAILVAVQLPEMEDADVRRSLSELENLLGSLGIGVADRIVQRRIQPSRVTYVGEGKLQELARLTGGTGELPRGPKTNLESLRTDLLVVADDELTPGQRRNLR